MLNIFKQKHKKLINKKIISNTNKFLVNNIYNNMENENKNENKNNINKSKKYFVPDTKEWYSSIYSYNKHYIKTLPIYNNTINQIIKSYFNLFYKNNLNTLTYKSSNINETKVLKQLSNKVLISQIEVKHTNTKVIVTIYVYNQQKKFLSYVLKNNIHNNSNYNKTLKSFSNLNKKIFKFKDEIICMTKKIQRKNLLLSNINKYIVNLLRFDNLKKNMLLYRHFTNQMLYINNLYLLKMNEYKFKDWFIIPLDELLSKVFNKKVHFNIINVKYPYLNSDLFLQLMSLKLKNRKIHLENIIMKFFKMLDIPFFTKKDIYTVYKPKISSNDNKHNNQDVLQRFLYKNLKNKNNKDEIRSDILKYISNRVVNGLKLHITGRLTHSYTASRSIFKVKILGSIKNLKSSHNNLSSVVLRGFVRSNLQYTKINSKTRNGSFGLKGWISSN